MALTLDRDYIEALKDVLRMGYDKGPLATMADWRRSRVSQAKIEESAGEACHQFFPEIEIATGDEWAFRMMVRLSGTALDELEEEAGEAYRETEEYWKERRIQDAEDFADAKAGR
jgi:hypothetical protein